MCTSTDCTGCAYSTLTGLLHSGSHRECYRRFAVRHLPWNIAARQIQRIKQSRREQQPRHAAPVCPYATEHAPRPENGQVVLLPGA
jgi:hypothetical protein